MKKNKNLIILILVLSVLSALPLFATAQDTGYVPLAPIPGVTPNNEPVVLANYLSGAFALAIGITGVLAVLVIMIGGIQYITSGSFSGKEDGKEKISKALIGLFLAIAAWIILYTINPDLLSLRLNIEKPEITQQTTTSQYSIEILKNIYQKQQFSCSYDLTQRGDLKNKFKNGQECQDWLENSFKNDRFAKKNSDTMWLREQFEGPSPSCQMWRCFGEDLYALNGTVEEKNPDQCVGQWETVYNYRGQQQFDTIEECENYIETNFEGKFTGPPACQYRVCEIIH